jgi:hypothetical protein
MCCRSDVADTLTDLADMTKRELDAGLDPRLLLTITIASIRGIAAAHNLSDD